MPIDPSIPLSVKPAEQIDPMGVLGKVMALKGAQQVQQGRDQEAQLRQQQIVEGQKKVSDDQALSSAYQKAWKPNEAGVITLDRNQLTSDMAATGHGDKLPAVLESLDNADKAAAAAKTAKADAITKTADAAGSLANGVKVAGYTVPAFVAAVHYLDQNQLLPPGQAQQYLQTVQADPSQVQAITDKVIAESQKQTELASASQTAASRVQASNTGATRLQAELPKIAADTTRVQQEATGTVPMTPYQQAELKARSASLALEQSKAAQSQGDKTDLTPQGLDAAAMMFAKTGQLPALGMGDKTTRKAIINRAAAMVPGLDVAGAKADYGANQSSLKNVTGTLDNLTAFENTAGKNLDQFLSLAAKVPDTGSPWLNTPLRLLNDKMVGSENQAAFSAARDVALREIARVTNDPKLSGVLSDSARQEVSSLSPKDATFAQIKKVASVLKQDMANVHSSLSDQREAIQGRIKLGRATQPAAATAPKFSVGDVVNVGGKQIKISAIHADGTFDGSPVK